MPAQSYPTMKVCSKCGEEKPLDAFHVKDRAKGWYQSKCKPCQSEYAKAHYRANSSVYIERAGKRNRQLRKQKMVLVAQLRQQPCTDCGKIHPPHRMQFDHRQGRTIKGRRSPEAIATMARSASVSLTQLIEEIKKCDIVCANCHCDRTWERRENPTWRIANGEGEN